MLGGTLRQGAAQWFIVKKTEIETVDQFFLELGNEFIPADLQERLRDQLGELSQGQSRGHDDYVSRFRHVITQVQEMSELDKIMYFVRGLAPAIRTERWTMTVRIVALRMEVGPTQNLVRWKWTMSESWVVKSVCVSAFASIAIDLDIERQSVVRRASRDKRARRRRRATQDISVRHSELVDQVRWLSTTWRQWMKLIIPLYGNDVRILIDSGASTNLIQRGLVKKVLNTAVIEAQGFDGRRTKKQVNEVEASCQVQDKKFEAMQFTEWDLPNSHDVIFGQPWFVKHNPIIDWRKQTFALPEDTSVHERSGSEICSKIKNAEYEELFVVKVSAVNDISPVVPPELKPVIDRFADCFPELLPDGLPPERAVNFELQPKPDAVPSSRPPFRLSKTEQDALEEFVRDNVKKGWIEVSNSPWISNIFGVPKKDPATGMAVKRAEWLRSGNTKVPIRWVIDYRYVNSQTKIPKIPLPHIEELFDQMLGATVFTVIDLAQGYLQMRVKPDSRPYTAFRSQKETYQWCVAPMGLAGMPGVWSRLMRVLFGKFKFVVVYLDDICIFSRSMKDHAQHLAMVCEVVTGHFRVTQHVTVLAHVSIMATNKAVREKLARQKGEGVGTLVETLRKREEDREVASSARRTTVTADAVDVPAESDGRSAPTSDSAPAISSELRFGDLPSVKPLFARALEEEEATEEFLVVDNDGSSLEDEGALTVKLGSIDEWVEYEELQSERHAAYLHELERDPSADVSMYRTKEENDAVEAVNNRKRKHEVLITNEEAGVRAIVHDELKYSLPEMPPPELWPAGKTASNLLARARLCARDYDAQFKNWREKRLRGENGELRIHPIPVVLFVGETEEEYDADFMSCISKIKGGSTRTVSTDPTAQRSQRMQFAVDRVRLFRSKQGGGTPLRAGGRAGNRRQITRANDSPSVAPQRRQQDPGRLREDAQQAPTSSATHRTHATSQGSGCSPYAAAHAAGAQHGSGAVPACQSAGQVAPYFASASVVAPDAMVQMVHANASSLGALQQAVRTLRQQYLDETSLLKQRVTALETELKEARQMLEEYHVRGKHFHARYAPRVKTLWERHNALVSRWAASEPPDETDVLPHWDKNPQ
ncbi:Retroelement pol polyprotein, partial [Globisporangium splendens]